MKHLPNIITSLRIVGSIGLLFCNVAGWQFWTLYVFCGISDMIDGWLARKLQAESKTGSVLDSTVNSLLAMDLGWNNRHHQDCQSDIVLDHHQKILLPSYYSQ